MIRYVINPNDYSIGQEFSRELWGELVRNYFLKFPYVAFRGVKSNSDYLGYEEGMSSLNLCSSGHLRIKMEWDFAKGKTEINEVVELYQTSEEFWSMFYSLSFRSWTSSNFPFDELFFLDEKKTC
ncbi:MAG: hypothetical protein OQK04_07695, partial [Kangiellaceae bacterium]|nr:hypothetical protein [Kangiellaceae bacterium]